MRYAIRRIALFGYIVLSLAILAPVAGAQTLSVLHTFTGGADGGYPYSGVTLDQRGRIYGTTSAGGGHNSGVVYRLANAGNGWVLSPLHTFGSHNNDGYVPLARVVFGPDGLLYGTTFEGGTGQWGTVFQLQPPPTACKTALCPWLETVLYNFTGGADGGHPGYGDLTFDQDGNIYGTTEEGGSTYNGVVFELTRSGSSWTESVLWNFTGQTDGSYPEAGVIFDSAGNLYGTTNQGAQGFGAIYELSPTQSGWNETTLYYLMYDDYGNATGGLVFDSLGNLFGLTSSAAYKLALQNGNWSFSILQTFTEQNQYAGSTPTFDAQGNLYGPLSNVDNGSGQIFKLTPSGNQWIYSPYFQFASCQDASGCDPNGPVIFDAGGNMYSTNITGGADNAGAVWEIAP